MQLMEELKRLLDYCESITDVEACKAQEQRNKDCINFKTKKATVKVNFPHPEWKQYSMEEIHADMQKMMFNEMVGTLTSLECPQNNGVAMIRPNYGVGILPSVFGAKCFIVNGNMPWCEHLGREGVKDAIKKGVPDYRNGFGQKILDTYAFYKDVLSAYPKLSQVIHMYHPDYQGPFDVAHLLFGSDIYMEFYDDPDLVCDLLELVNATYIDSMRKVKEVIKDETDDGFVYHWGNLYPGSIVVRNDSSVNLSNAMYNDYVRPIDEKLLNAFGGGSMHFCGRADHWVADMAASEPIKGFNFGYMNNIQFGQPYLDFIKPYFTDKKRPIISYVLEKKDYEGFDFDKYNTGILFTVSKPDKQSAIEYLKKFE